MKTFKTFQLLTIVLAALFFQLPNQIHGSREQNEAITRLLQEMIELKHQSEGQHGNLQSRPETNMMGSRQSEDDSLSQDWPDINTMEFSSKPSPEFNLKIDGCEDMSSSIENSLKILLKPFGGEVTIACPKKGEKKISMQYYTNYGLVFMSVYQDKTSGGLGTRLYYA